jgi:thiamine-monophosphate kinase
VLLGIGDDAAAWQPSRSHRSIVTTDALVDGVHFSSARTSARAIGHRAMASNLSDVAAMGARPVLAVVALGVPADTEAEWILEAYRGLDALARRHGARVVGGDIVRAPVLTFAVTVIGEVSPTRLRTRSGGRSGDVLALTGPLGASRAGLELLAREAPVALEVREAALRAHETPAPRLAEGRWLAASTNVHAMMDCSDGLSSDVARLAAASRLRAVVDDVPVDPVAVAVACACAADPLAYALDGGEDFELLVAIAPRAFNHLAAAFARRFGRALLRIGALREGAGVALRGPDGERDLDAGGWDNLAAR